MYIITTSMPDGQVLYYDGNAFTKERREAKLMEIQDAISTRHKIRPQYPCCDILTV